MRGERGSVDREDVILELETCLTSSCRGFKPGVYCPFNDDVWNSVRDAVAMLKAQEPVEPVVDIDTWKCGNCGHTLEHQQLLGDNVLFHEQYNYCPDCGGKVKWG